MELAFHIRLLYLFKLESLNCSGITTTPTESVFVQEFDEPQLPAMSLYNL